MHHNAEIVAQIRAFNRFYTRRIGLLEATISKSAYTLTEARVLFELGHRAANAAASSGTGLRAHLSNTLHLNIGPAATDIAEELRVDPSYMTRILRKFADHGLTEVRPDPADGRRRILSLTAKGQAALRTMQAEADSEIGDLVAELNEGEIAELSGTLRRSAELLGDRAPGREIVLRPHRVGDVGWVIERQSRLYAEEYGWESGYEALVCDIGGRFLREFKPGREFCWIAERGQDRLGAVFLVQRDQDVGQLRMLHVERHARGLGIGQRLVAECVATARRVGYRKLMLWTNDPLVAARRLYEKAGFVLVDEADHADFGYELHGQTWELAL